MNRKLFVESLKSALVWIVMLSGLLAYQHSVAWDGDLGGNEYRASEARRYQNIKVGTVEDIRVVQITRESSNGDYVGSAAGAIIGGLIGNQAGSGRGRLIATAIGGTVGGLAGRAVGQYVGRETKQAAEIVVSLSNGNAVSIVQELDNGTAQLRPGDRVRLIEGQSIRVVKLGGYNM